MDTAAADRNTLHGVTLQPPDDLHATAQEAMADAGFVSGVRETLHASRRVDQEIGLSQWH